MISKNVRFLVPLFSELGLIKIFLVRERSEGSIAFDNVIFFLWALLVSNSVPTPADSAPTTGWLREGSLDQQTTRRESLVWQTGRGSDNDIMRSGHLGCEKRFRYGALGSRRRDTQREGRASPLLICANRQIIHGRWPVMAGSTKRAENS